MGGNGWSPANELETAMHLALVDANIPEFFRLISSACLLLPVSAAAAEGREPVSWFRTTDYQRSYLPVFTSPEA